MNLADLRREYAAAELDESSSADDPIVQFAAWFADARAAGIPEPNAMTLATATAAAVPSARVVLLKGFGEDGFVFFSDHRSRKGRELAENPRAALVFFWGEIERQVRITGTVDHVDRATSAEYFRSRPEGSRIGAWASEQSAAIASRDVLEDRVRHRREQFGTDEIPLPPHWGGYRVVPAEVEFWQGRPSRLHDRLLYTRTPELAWHRVRLSP